jgi:hypothetical protein
MKPDIEAALEWFETSTIPYAVDGRAAMSGSGTQAEQDEQDYIALATLRTEFDRLYALAEAAKLRALADSAMGRLAIEMDEWEAYLDNEEAALAALEDTP